MASASYVLVSYYLAYDGHHLFSIGLAIAPDTLRVASHKLRDSIGLKLANAKTITVTIDYSVTILVVICTLITVEMRMPTMEFPGLRLSS